MNTSAPEQDTQQRVEPGATSGGRRRTPYLRRILLQYALAAGFLLLFGLFWYASSILLLIFSAILIAVLLCSASGFLEKWCHLGHGAALAIVLLLGVGILAGGGWLLAPRVTEQANQLISSLPSAMATAREFLAQLPMLKGVLDDLPESGSSLDLGALASRAESVFTGMFGVVANVIIVVFLSIYLAAQPQLYVNGFVTLFPISRRERLCQVLRRIGSALGLWLLGKMFTMLVVGTTIAIGLTLLDMPLALVLGLVAGLFEFIPYLGPILAGVPAVLLAFSQDPTLAFYVFLLFAAVQMGEGYLLTPLIDRHTVELPPALTISMQVLLAVPFGLLGVALASPLTATILVLVSTLYVQDVLGDPVDPPGEDR